MPVPSGRAPGPLQRTTLAPRVPAHDPQPPRRASLETAKRLTEATPPYPCGDWILRNRTTGEVIPFSCKRWTCPECSPRLVSRWSKLIAEAPITRHLVFTSLGRDAATARARLRNITKGVRRGEASDRSGRRSPAVFEWFCALEGREAPGYHAHLLAWGDYLPQRSLSRLLSRYGAGPVSWVRSLTPTDRSRHVHAYVVDHLVGKVHPDQPKIGRRVRYSRNFWQGATAAQVAARLWPPDPTADWELLHPELDRWRAQQELAADARSEYYRERRARILDAEELKLLRTLSAAELDRRGITFPVLDPLPAPLDSTHYTEGDN